MGSQATTQAQQGKAATAKNAEGVLRRKCACGTHTIGGAECDGCRDDRMKLSRAAVSRAAPPGDARDARAVAHSGPLRAQDLSRTPLHSGAREALRPKLAVSAPGDAHEQEADRVAEQLAASHAPAKPGATPPRIQRFTTRPGGQEHSAPPSVERSLAGAGRPLEPSLRRDMEGRFGHDFTPVRVHTDAAAEQSARDVSAHAYTVGSDIVFGAGRFAPSTDEGMRLLAHELTHVVQQSSGNVFLGKQDAKDEPKKKTKTKTISIPPGTESVKEFRLYAEFQIFGRVLNLDWTPQGQLPEIYSDITKHIGQKVTFTFPASYLESMGAGSDKEMAAAKEAAAHDYAALGVEERGVINEEIDRRYYTSLKEESGTKIKSGETGKAAIWNSLKQQVLEDKRKIEALPEDIKDVLFAGGPDAPAITPENYTQVLRIAEKLAQIPPEARQDYLARVNASTTSLDSLESSVDSYIKFRGQREKEVESHEAASKPLFGVEDVYAKYRFYQLFLKNADEDSLGGDASDDEKKFVKGIRDAQIDSLRAALKAKGFDSIESFEADIEAYRVAFRTQAVNLALDVLARYDHMLFEEREKLQKPGGAAAVAQGIAASKASELYEEAGTQRDIASTFRTGHEPRETWWIEPAREADEAAGVAEAQANAEVISGSGNDPLVAERGTDREKLAGLDVQDMPSYLFETLGKREQEVRKARAEFNEDPDRVFKLPDLVGATKQIIGVDSNTVYGKIIDDYIADEHAKHLLSTIAKTIVGVALLFLAPVGGWVAAAALVASAGLSTYEAYSAYKEYEEQERDYNLHFLSEEPSLFWVGVAIAAAALDLGVAASAVVKESAAALKALKGPMLDFSKDGEFVKLASQIEAAEGLKAEVKEALKREAEASLAAKKVMKESGGKLFAVTPAGVVIGATVQGFRVLYYSIKRGLNTLARLRADAKFIEVVGDITRMTGAERAELEAAFEEVKQLVKVGSSKSMDDASLLGYVDRWAINRGRPGFKATLFDEMKAWKPPTAEQKQALESVVKQKGVVSDLYKEKEALISERRELRVKQKDPLTKSTENGERVKEIDARLNEIDPGVNAKKTRQLVQVWNEEEGAMETQVIEVEAKTRPGEIKRAEEYLAITEKKAEQANVTLYDRLRAAAPSDKAKQEALKGVTSDKVGPLLTKPGDLEVDHIVSVREISDMDGFDKLPWKDQKAVVDLKENLIPMDGSANSSKGDRTWTTWPQARNFYGPSTIDAMIKREADVRAAILAEIQKRLKQPAP
ncbi:MAG TPA: DUF4157 domain-containing protein [Pyrinomonadaceae bacterium]|jgi:hypothetical protein|nr:DUF4157 domain-containing protein [Pyrinomonadaceae bacterium]